MWVMQWALRTNIHSFNQRHLLRLILFACPLSLASLFERAVSNKFCAQV